MAKKKNNMMMIVIVIALLIVAYLIYKEMSNKEPLPKMSGGDDEGYGGLEKGCYAFEEVHESGTPGEMWLSIIPKKADGSPAPRPPKGAVWVGGYVRVKNTNSALDSTYRVQNIYYSLNEPNVIGSFRVNIPGGYTFNYNATQGGDVRDMTYFGIGKICIIDQLKY